MRLTRRLLTWPAAVVAIVAVSAFVIGIRYGTFAASDTDPFGYVSQAELIASGAWRIDQRSTLQMPWRDAELSFIPDGYKRGTEPGFIVPTFPPGLPLVMAAALRATGSRDAVYYVVPVFGALAVWLTALLGARLHSRELGAAAALLLATSPVFLYQLMQPASDIPAAAWWTASLVLAFRGKNWSAFAAGLAASCALFTRPNLAPQAAVIAAWLLWPAVRGGSGERRAALVKTATFVAAIVPACLAIAMLNTHLYGGPFRSGYAPLADLYRLEHVVPNLARYPRWLLETQTPFIFLGLAAPVVIRQNARIWPLFAFATVLFVSYLFFGYFEVWVYLRFLLPAFPALLVLGLMVAAHLLRRVVPRPETVILVTSLLVCTLAAWQGFKAYSADAFRLQAIEHRYVRVGRYVATAMPRDAVYIAALHAGSIRHYSGAQTINFNALHPRALGEAVSVMTKMGRRVYFVVEDGELALFRWRFDTYTDLGKLDWPPAHRTELNVKVALYDPADRARFLAGMPIVTFDMDPAAKPTVTERGRVSEGPQSR